MSQDCVDSALKCRAYGGKKVPSIEALNSEMPGKLQKDRGKRIFKTLLNRLRMKKCASATISRPDPTYKVAYLGNVVTGWAKGEGCVEKPLATLWKNYTQSSRPDVRMVLTIGGGGLKATTKDHGLTEYWAHRLTSCSAPSQFPRLFCWVYRHEGRRLRHELRCHAVLCPSAAVAQQIEQELRQSLALALLEFKRDKLSRQNARLALVNSVYDNPTMPKRKIMLSTGQSNYRPPLERSKSAPKLSSIEEILEEDEEPKSKHNKPLSRNAPKNRLFKHYDSLGQIGTNCTKSSAELSKLEPKTRCKVQFSDTILEMEQTESLLQDLVHLSGDFVESCERAWLTVLEQPDSDEGSLSSGCDSASTVTSDLEPNFTAQIEEIVPELANSQEIKEPDFKLGKLCPISNNYSQKTSSSISSSCDEVSLIPLGEINHDFSSLKVFKKRLLTDRGDIFASSEEVNVDDCEDGENTSACSDESGYEEEELASSVATIVLV